MGNDHQHSAHAVTPPRWPRSGSARRCGSITKWPTHRIVSAGIARIPEGRRVFPERSALDDLRLGAYRREDSCQAEIDDAFRAFPILEKRMNQMEGRLSGGERQVLAMSRALEPRPTATAGTPISSS